MAELNWEGSPPSIIGVSQTPSKIGLTPAHTCTLVMSLALPSWFPGGLFSGALQLHMKWPSFAQSHIHLQLQPCSFTRDRGFIIGTFESGINSSGLG